jgi:hypothetical protein
MNESVTLTRRPTINTLAPLPDPGKYTLADVIHAEAAYALHRSGYGFIPKFPGYSLTGSWGLLTPPAGNAKYAKSKQMVFGLARAQHRLSILIDPVNGINECPYATAGCIDACVGKNGSRGFPSSIRAAVVKTTFRRLFPMEFSILLCEAIRRAVLVGRKLHKRIGVRLNSFSDENYIESAAWLFVRFPRVAFYDYTKDWSRESLPNYSLTYSASERTHDASIILACLNGKNVAVVFMTKKGDAFPATYLGIPVFDGDATDFRPADPRGVIIGLRAKGKMRRNTFGFARAV